MVNSIIILYSIGILKETGSDRFASNRIFNFCSVYAFARRVEIAGWDIDELEWICYNLDCNNKIFDPHNFINDKFAYVDHVKTCYYLDNNE